MSSASAIEPPATPSVSLQVCAPNSIAVGSASVLWCRLANSTAAPTTGVLLAESHYFRFLDRREYRIALSPGEESEVEFELLSEQKGHCRLTLRWLTDNGREFEGSVSLTVGAENQSAPVIQVNDNRKTEGKFIVGQKSDLHVHVDNTAGPSGIARAGEYLPVALRSVASTVQSRAMEESSGQKRIHRNGSPGPLLEDSRLCLRFRVGNEVRNIGLLAMRRACLGKQRGRNHLVLRVQPRNSENDILTDRLSRHHADLEFTLQGPIWRNAECANGTLVDDKRLGRLEEAPIRAGRIFRAADAVALRATTCAGPALGKRGHQYAEFVRKQLPGAAPPEPELGPIHAVRFRREDVLASQEEYVWFQTAACIGRDSGCPIHLEDPSVAMLHAVILRLGGRFWLEPQQSTHETRINGVRVHLNELAPVTPGSTITIGSLEISVAEFQQLGIDF